MRWLFHILTRQAHDAWSSSDGDYAPPSLATDGFIHTSYREQVAESAKLYFPADAELVVMRIDPHKLDVRVEEAPTPRGPMPHVFGPIPRAAIDGILSLEAVAERG